MITNETISKTIEAALEDGYEITVEDISKAVLARHYEDWTNITADELREGPDAAVLRRLKAPCGCR